ncbi:MAG TPA: trypsin-like peptidase domain-containing protein [Chthoniobacterales bacterium]|nr:trypsin-like peptidase domain-containing protein [Chthoniobacterales bacterium]
MKRHQLLRFTLFLLLLLLSIAGLFLWKFFQSEPQTITSYRARNIQHRVDPLHEGASLLQSSALDALDGEFTKLVNKVIPSVVSITTMDAPNREILLRQFFGLSKRESAPSSKMGSGMIVSEKGHIVTNWHVIKDAMEVTVQLDDGRTFPAALTGYDERADIAILKIKATKLTPITLGDSDQVKVGQMVVAVGNPFGLQETVTQGIISAKGRRAMSEAANEFFQTSTLINPGNSGGPLVNIHGEVIGINNFIITQSGGAEGLSFAIPSNVARRVYNDIIEHGRVIRPWFGVVMRPLNSVLAQQLGLPNTAGALVVATLVGSPAERVGIHSGDIITTFNDHSIKDWIDLRNRIAETKAGENIVLTILREGHSMNMNVTIEEEPGRQEL